MILIEKKYGSIILIDALGTKSRWKNKDGDKIFEKWEKFLDLLDDIIKKVNSPNTEKHHEHLKIRIHSFSDTILITLPTSIEKIDHSESQRFEIIDNIETAGLIAVNILEFGLLTEFAFRGCISFGEFFENDRTITGQALIDAAEYYEKPNWIGVSLSPSAHIKMSNKVSNTLTKYDIPTKEGIEIDGLAVLLGNSDKPPLDFLREKYPEHKAFYEMITSKSSLEALIKMSFQTNDFSASLKIRNTLAFLNNK